MNNNNLLMTHPQVKVKGNTVEDIVFGKNTGIYPYMYLGAAIYNKSDFLENYNGDNSGMVEKMILSKLAKKEKVNAIIYSDEWRHLMNDNDYQIIKNEKNWLES